MYNISEKLELAHVHYEANFSEWLDDFIVVYIDNILIYIDFMVEHLRKVFQS